MITHHPRGSSRKVGWSKPDRSFSPVDEAIAENRRAQNDAIFARMAHLDRQHAAGDHVLTTSIWCPSCREAEGVL